MNISYVNNSDLIGQRFNGYDMHITLNKLGYRANYFVAEKLSDIRSSISITDENSLFVRSIVEKLEEDLGLNNILYPFGKMMMNHKVFKSSDIVHFHLMHNKFLSLFDVLEITRQYKSVWTIHDPWAITKGCIHPFECEKWKEGCTNCIDPISKNINQQMFNLKMQMFKQMKLNIIVSSNFMEQLIRKSPLTEHFEDVHKIPFGLNESFFSSIDKYQARNVLNIPLDKFVIAFRADKNPFKGLEYIIKALYKLNTDKDIFLLTIGGKNLPDYIKKKYPTKEIDWSNSVGEILNFYCACDVFLMPSLAESFGLMAIEAMANGKPVVVFDNTPLPEITFAPKCGIVVPYKNVNKLQDTINRLINNPLECRCRGEKGKQLAKQFYTYRRYINDHIELYNNILDK